MIIRCCVACGCSMIERKDLARDSWEEYYDCSNTRCDVRVHKVFGDMGNPDCYYFEAKTAVGSVQMYADKVKRILTDPPRNSYESAEHLLGKRVLIGGVGGSLVVGNSSMGFGALLMCPKCLTVKFMPHSNIVPDGGSLISFEEINKSNRKRCFRQ